MEAVLPDESIILHVEMMVFYVNVSQTLMIIRVTAGSSDSIGLEGVTGGSALLTGSTAAGDAGGADLWTTPE